MSQKRPNILLITTDQQRHDHIGIAGMKGIATPNLDRLGTEGLHFRRAYCPAPLCTPTRVSLLTGRYPSSHYAYSIGVTPDPFPSPTIPELMGQHGYRTALFGKHHFVSRVDEDAHISGQEDPGSEFYRNFNGPYVGFQEFQGSSGHTINTQVEEHYKVWLEDQGVDYEAWFPQLRPGYDHHRCGVWEIPTEYHDTQWVGNLTADYMERQSGEQPWFCWASFQDPHEPFVCPEPWYSRVDESQIELFEHCREGEFDDRHPIYGGIYEGDLSEWHDEKGVPCVQGRGAYAGCEREALRATLGMIGFIDEQVGRFLDVLEKTGQADNTLIIFTSDHGEMHGHHGLWGKGYAAYEDCQRVPFLVWGPGLLGAKGSTDALANLVDLPRTFLSLAAIPLPQGMQGTDLSPVFKGEKKSVQEETMVECRGVRNLSQRTLVTDRYKLVVYSDGTEPELYDLKEDPEQYRNFYGWRAYRHAQKEMMERLTSFEAAREGVVHARRAFG